MVNSLESESLAWIKTHIGIALRKNFVFETIFILYFDMPFSRTIYSFQGS